MGPTLGAPLALGVVLSILSGSLGCARLLYNFGEVDPARIYRAAQPSPLFLRWLVVEFPNVIHQLRRSWEGSIRVL